MLAIIVWYVLNRTAYGRHIYATGDDPEAARLAGINTDRILLSVYVLAGLIAAIAGWALIGRIGAISPTAGANANLDSITAVVIGGTSLFGGRGSIVGTLIGALIVGVFRSAVSLAGLDVLWQEFAIGVLIIVAVALDQWIRRVVEMSADASPAGARPRQALWPRHRARPRRFRSLSGRDPRRDRRQRRRQVDADQGALRRRDPRFRAKSGSAARS